MLNFTNLTADTFEDQARVCPQSWCGNGTWLVQRDPHMQDVWHVAHATGGSWTVAASEPVCPRCGATLVIPLALPNRDEQTNTIQPQLVLEQLLTA